MKVNTCLILAAGFGTRMGEIGKVLPKVLWPVFEKSLLELQIKYAKDLGCKKIYINTHYQADKVSKHLESIGETHNVIILHEDPILDSGGAIHNLASQKEINYQGNVLLLNGDQFYFLDKKTMNSSLKELNENKALLFAIKVDKNSTYNETLISEKNILTQISKPKANEDFLTYSGVGIINLEKMKPVPGASKFFETVAPIKTNKVVMKYFEDIEYWDFGTVKRFQSSLIDLLHKKEASTFYKYLINQQAIIPGKIIKSNYGTSVGLNNIVLDPSYEGSSNNSIILKNTNKSKTYDNKIVFDEIEQDIEY